MKDTMSREERLQAVFRCRVPDRVPVVPLLGYFLSQYAGITSAELWSDEKKRSFAWEKFWNELGPVDAIYHDNGSEPLSQLWTIPMKTLWPGKELPPTAQAQQKEEEVMTVEDYQWLIHPGIVPKSQVYGFHLMKLLQRTCDGLPKNLILMLPTLYWKLLLETLWFRSFRKFWEKRGVPRLWGSALMAPFDHFSLLRSIGPFSRDTFQRPDEIAAAADACVDSFVFLSQLVAGIIGTRRTWIFLHRSSNSFISPKQFKSLSFPSLKSIISKLAARGFDLILHCDGNWDKNLETLLELPPQRCMIQFDGASNIFRAKEILKGHSCIYGDVPAQLLVTGSPEDTDKYCKKLIEIVGKDGGFCLGSGCELAPDAKPENVKAMFQSVQKYGYYS
jgi:hypothetical protein